MFCMFSYFFLGLNWGWIVSDLKVGLNNDLSEEKLFYFPLPVWFEKKCQRVTLVTRAGKNLGPKYSAQKEKNGREARRRHLILLLLRWMLKATMWSIRTGLLGDLTHHWLGRCDLVMLERSTPSQSTRQKPDHVYDSNVHNDHSHTDSTTTPHYDRHPDVLVPPRKSRLT